MYYEYISIRVMEWEMWIIDYVTSDIKSRKNHCHE